jgi:prepilin-type N-terminal cleavage/methylation domain-containing protein
VAGKNCLFSAGRHKMRGEGIMMEITNKNENGFTMIEILAAMLVFAIGILAVGQMQVTAIKGNSFASGLTEATTLAQDKMEELIMLGYTHGDLNDTDGDGANGLRDPLPPLPAQPIPDPATYPADYQVASGLYNLYWNIAPDVSVNNTKTINVIVTWTDKGTPKSVWISSLKPQM